MISSLVPRRSPRLLEKEAGKNIQQVLDRAGIDSMWVFTDDLFSARVDYDDFRSYTDGCTKKKGGYCEECDEADEFFTKEFNLPSNTFTKDQLLKPMKELLALNEKTKQPTLKLIYSVAFMRMVHGPARCLLKYPRFAANVKEKCLDLPEQMKTIGLDTTEMGKRMYSVCTELLAVITANENEEYNIFHGF
jgi:hypothetical protein